MMGKNSTVYLDHQEQQHYELGFIHRNTLAHYKGQDILMDIQSHRAKLNMLKGEIATYAQSEHPEVIECSEAYHRLVMRAQNEKSQLCALLDAYITGSEAILDAARQELVKELQSPIVPETHKSLVKAA